MRQIRWTMKASWLPIQRTTLHDRCNVVLTTVLVRNASKTPNPEGNAHPQCTHLYDRLEVATFIKARFSHFLLSSTSAHRRKKPWPLTLFIPMNNGLSCQPCRLCGKSLGPVSGRISHFWPGDGLPFVYSTYVPYCRLQKKATCQALRPTYKTSTVGRRATHIQ